MKVMFQAYTNKNYANRNPYSTRVNQNQTSNISFGNVVANATKALEITNPHLIGIRNVLANFADEILLMEETVCRGRGGMTSTMKDTAEIFPRDIMDSLKIHLERLSNEQRGQVDKITGDEQHMVEGVCSRLPIYQITGLYPDKNTAMKDLGKRLAANCDGLAAKLSQIPQTLQDEFPQFVGELGIAPEPKLPTLPDEFPQFVGELRIARKLLGLEQYCGKYDDMIGISRY